MPNYQNCVNDLQDFIESELRKLEGDIIIDSIVEKKDYENKFDALNELIRSNSVTSYKKGQLEAYRQILLIMSTHFKN